MSKYALLKRNGGPNSALTELKILGLLQSSYICNSHYAFQDNFFLHLVIDLSLGGDLKYNLTISQNGRFSEELTKFYACQLILALDCCHKVNILHRDVKPENILLSSNGYIKLSDFGISKILPNIEDCKSTSGTHGYMAPEIYCSPHRHGIASEWFSFGVTLYELLTGRRPFEPQTFKRLSLPQPSPLDEFEPLQLGTFNNRPDISLACKEFVGQCLILQPVSRLGANSVMELKSHRWLRSVDWDSLALQKVKPLFVPDISKSRFDLSGEDTQRAIQEQVHPHEISSKDQILFMRYGFRNRYYTTTLIESITSEGKKNDIHECESSGKRSVGSVNLCWSDSSNFESSFKRRSLFQEMDNPTKSRNDDVGLIDQDGYDPNPSPSTADRKPLSIHTFKHWGDASLMSSKSSDSKPVGPELTAHTTARSHKTVLEEPGMKRNTPDMTFQLEVNGTETFLILNHNHNLI